ncbi:cellulose synthase subunit BcsC [Pseudovibrio axinellae]|uniref:Cellulose synthase subunit BcsC n=1 Tax=Pseudovibrio axinellae TaxID=989403 RepID=A0A161VB14_9HYPH|nr:tetratricopeptide repeat protein [Pseudovibrio axinellae]KZL21274.1 cellulose synthase subunit BcsC [Pseudovibrio axinellae]SEQ94358.1 Tetratricopeptide repeat-containing protein [Pseudovibrio axinellae]
MTLKSYFALFRSNSAYAQNNGHMTYQSVIKTSFSKNALLASTMVLALFSSPLAPVEDAKASSRPLPAASSLSGSYLSGRSALLARDFDGASNYFSAALKSDPSNFYLLDRAFVISLANGDIEHAFPLAQRILEEDQDHFLAQLATAVRRVQLGDFETQLPNSVTQDVNPLSRLTFAIVSAWEKAGQGKADEAIADLTSTTGEKWFDLFVNFNAGLVAEYANTPSQAAEFYKVAYEIDRGALRNAISYTRMLAASGRQQEALDIIAEYEQLIPEHPLLISLREKIESGKIIESVAKTPADGLGEALHGLGIALSKEGEELAANYLQLAVYLNPKNDSALIGLASLFEQLGDNQRAIEYLSQVPDSSPMKREAEIQIALHYNVQDNLEEARAHLEKLVEADPSDLEAITSLGNVLRSHSLFEEAETSYNQGLKTISEIQANHWTLLYFRGITRERQDKWSAAEEDFRDALTLKPEQPMILNYLGYSLVDRGLKLDEAQKMIERAVRLRPTDGYIVDSLGWVYYRLGRYSEAVERLERAVTLRPHDPIINDHLGDAYWQIGRKLEARYKWNHARDLNPEPEDMERILSKIENGMDEAVPVGLASSAENK